MIPFIAFGLVMLIAVFLLNYKMDREKVKPYEYLIRFTCAVGMQISFSVSYYRHQKPHPVLALLLLILLVYPQFFAQDYVQYRKNKDDLESCQHFIKQAIIWAITIMGVIAAAIYCYFKF